MKVSYLPKDVRSIFENQKEWDPKIKDIKDDDLVDSIEAVIDHADRKEDGQAFKFASRAIAELNGRKYSKNHPKRLDELTTRLQSTGKNCLLSSNNGIEAISISTQTLDPESESSKELHLYPHSKRAKRVIKKWQKTDTNKSFEEFLQKRVPERKKQALVKDTVIYLSKSQRADYRTTFHHGKIKIGGKKPKDGKYMFALSHKGDELLVGQKEKGKFHHSSFYSGHPVQCAGYFYIKDEKIQKVSLRSGHYKPTPEHGQKLRAYLSKSSHLGEKAHHLEIRNFAG